jgi:hypothetical protein
MSRRFCLYCGGALARDRHRRVVHAQWWRRLMCLTPTPLGPVLRNDREGDQP